MSAAKNVERFYRYSTELGMSFMMTYGQILLPGVAGFLSTIAVSMMAAAAIFYLLDFVIYAIFHPYLFDGTHHSKETRTPCTLMRAGRNFFELLASSAAFQVFMYATVTNNTTLQITTAVLTLVLKGFIEYFYEAAEETQEDYYDFKFV